VLHFVQELVTNSDQDGGRLLRDGTIVQTLEIEWKKNVYLGYQMSMFMLVQAVSSVYTMFKHERRQMQGSMMSCTDWRIGNECVVFVRNGKSQPKDSPKCASTTDGVSV
jgi:hypothetical protein